MKAKEFDTMFDNNKDITWHLEFAESKLPHKKCDELVRRKSFHDTLDRGLTDAESGKVYSTEELKSVLDARRKRK